MPMLTFNNWSPFGHIRLDEDLWHKFTSGVWSCDASCADVTAKGEVLLGGSRCWGFQAAHASPMTHVGHRTTEQLLPSLENHGFRHCWLNALVLGSLLLKQNVDRKLDNNWGLNVTNAMSWLIHQLGVNSTTHDVVRCPIYPFKIHFVSFSTLQEAEGHWVLCR